MTHRNLQTIQEKTEEMVQQGQIFGADFNDLDQWDQSNPTQRDLTLDEQNQLRQQAEQKIEEHQRQKQNPAPGQ